MPDYQFAFRPGQLDRAAQLRLSDAPRQDARALTLVFWRGKLLADAAGPARPLVPLDHPALTDSREAPLFVGLTPEGPRFAADLPLWTPPEDAATIGQFVDQSPAGPSRPSPTCKFVEIRGLMPTLTQLEGETVATGRALLSWHSARHRFCANCGAPSAVESSGWVRKCPQCGTQHFPRTDPVVIMAITRGDKLLLGRGPSWPERMYSLLAGFVEPGETIENGGAPRDAGRGKRHQGRTRALCRLPALAVPDVADVRVLWRGRERGHHDRSGGARRCTLGQPRRGTRHPRGRHPEINCPRPGAIAGGLIEAWAHGRLLDPDYWRN
jgi:NAD+ diphosphatase